MHIPLREGDGVGAHALAGEEVDGVPHPPGSVSSHAHTLRDVTREERAESDPEEGADADEPSPHRRARHLVAVADRGDRHRREPDRIVDASQVLLGELARVLLPLGRAGRRCDGCTRTNEGERVRW